MSKTTQDTLKYSWAQPFSFKRREWLNGDNKSKSNGKEKRVGLPFMNTSESWMDQNTQSYSCCKFMSLKGV